MTGKPGQKHKHPLINFRNLIILLIILALLSFGFFVLGDLFENPREAAEKFSSLGPFGPVAIIFLITLEVIMAPIPGTVIGIAAGYAFGVVWGSIYSYLGNVIGAAIAFYLAQRFGRKFISNLVSRDKLDRYDRFFKLHGRPLLWLMYIFPVLPSDIMSFVVGLSKLKITTFLSIIMIAYIPNMILLNYFGATLYEDGLGRTTIIVAILMITVFAVGYILYYLMNRAGNKGTHDHDDQ